MQSTKRKKPGKERESRMVRPVASLLREMGFGFVVREIPYFYSAVDVFGVNDFHCAAIELKVTRWQKGIRQARIYQLFAHKAYICMPMNYTSRPPRELLQKLGIGLIAVEFARLRPILGAAMVLLEAQDSPILKPRHAAMMADKAQRLGKKTSHRVEV